MCAYPRYPPHPSGDFGGGISDTMIVTEARLVSVPETDPRQDLLWGAFGCDPQLHMLSSHAKGPAKQGEGAEDLQPELFLERRNFRASARKL